MPTTYALTVGINDFPGTGSDLAGCRNDATDAAAAFRDRGATVETLLDSDATAANITSVMRSLIAAARYGDTVLFWISTHGTRVPDRDGDELDKWDEALCPWDFRSRLIVDDDLHAMFSERRHGVRVVMVPDTCHSGTISRLAAPIGDEDRRVRFLAPEVVFPDETFPDELHLPVPRGKPRHEALLLSGCADPEYSYDARFNGRPNGAFTYVALRTLERLPRDATWRDWHTAIRTALPSQDYPQTPQLYGSAHMKRWPITR